MPEIEQLQETIRLYASQLASVTHQLIMAQVEQGRLTAELAAARSFEAERVEED